MSKEKHIATALISTVADNKSKYTNAGYSKALLARITQKIIGRPSLQTYLQLIDEKRLKKCPVTRADIFSAKDILGPEVGSIKGKTVRIGAESVQMDLEQIPATIMERYRRVTLGADIMFVNKIPFFVIISRAIKFGTLELLKNRKIPTILEAVRHVYRTYKQQGFQIYVILVDG